MIPGFTDMDLTIMYSHMLMFVSLALLKGLMPLLMGDLFQWKKLWMMSSLPLKLMARRSGKSMVILFGLSSPVGKEICGSNGFAALKLWMRLLKVEKKLPSILTL